MCTTNDNFLVKLILGHRVIKEDEVSNLHGVDFSGHG